MWHGEELNFEGALSRVVIIPDGPTTRQNSSDHRFGRIPCLAVHLSTTILLSPYLLLNIHSGCMIRSSPLLIPENPKFLSYNWFHFFADKCQTNFLLFFSDNRSVHLTIKVKQWLSVDNRTASKKLRWRWPLQQRTKRPEILENLNTAV